jgi:hypothetical protein
MSLLKQNLGDHSRILSEHYTVSIFSVFFMVHFFTSILSSFHFIYLYCLLYFYQEMVQNFVCMRIVLLTSCDLYREIKKAAYIYIYI